MRVKIPAALIASALLFTGCSKDGAQENGQKATEEAFAAQSRAVPYPKEQIVDSLERRNLAERLLRQNKPAAISYVYILGDTGIFIGYYAIKGKVSSTQSQMTTKDLVITNNNSDAVVGAPGDDGSYGDNEPGIFFFTTEGVMVTTSMRYIVSDAALEVKAPQLNTGGQK